MCDVVQSPLPISITFTSSSSSSESKKEYSPKYGRRSKGAKRDPTLRSDGLEFGEGTESSTYVQVLMIVMANMSNFMNLMELGENIFFQEGRAQKPEKAKAVSNLSTSKATSHHNFLGSETAVILELGNLCFPLKDPFSERTETLTKYVVQHGRRAKVK